MTYPAQDVSVPVGELIREIRKANATPIHVKRGQDMPHWRVQANLIWMVVALLEDLPVEVLWIARVSALCFPCHDHKLT